MLFLNWHKEIDMTNEKILEEIFLTPSNIIIEHRFDHLDNAAPCNSKCIGPGGCKSLVIETK